MRPSQDDAFHVLLESTALSDRHKSLLRTQIPEIAGIKRKALTAKIWHYVLSLTTATGGVVISALGGQTFTGQFVLSIHWLLFSLGLVVTICGIISSRFSFGKRMQRYELAVFQMRGKWLKFFRLVNTCKDEQCRTDAVYELLSELDQVQSILVSDDPIEVIGAEEKRQEDNQGNRLQSAAQPQVKE